MSYRVLLSGQNFVFDSVKEVLAKANEEKSGDTLAGVAARSDMERIAGKSGCSIRAGRRDENKSGQLE